MVRLDDSIDPLKWSQHEEIDLTDEQTGAIRRLAQRQQKERRELMAERLTPLQSLLGRAGEPPVCKVFSDDIAVHWWPPTAKPGDPCFCGKSVKSGED